MNDKIKIIPISKKDEIISLINKYDFTIETDEAELLEIKLTSEYKEELWIEISGEFSIFFGDWHAHYIAEAEEYACFIDDLTGILENRKCARCSYYGERWGGSDLADADRITRTHITDTFGSGKTVRCNFWDSSRNIVFQPTE